MLGTKVSYCLPHNKFITLFWTHFTSLFHCAWTPCWKTLKKLGNAEKVIYSTSVHLNQFFRFNACPFL